MPASPASPSQWTPSPPMPSLASPASPAPTLASLPPSALPSAPASRPSRSTAFSCAAGTTTRSGPSLSSLATKASSFASSNSCRSKKTASGLPHTVVPIREVEARLQQFRPLRLLPPNSPGETARRYTFDDGVGEIGIIAPVSQAFCGACSRIRLTADGQVRTCLFSHAEHDLYGPLHRGASDNDLADIIRHAVSQKEERHHIGEPGFLPPSRTMVQIGG